jgi:2-polyprenyl-3-methyl-5-hydroxy-6-metoxy-1,4-benzoquinol methylase
MVYLNPVFTDDALVEFYSNNHTSQSATVESDMTFYRTIYGTGLGLIDEHLKQKQRILDFGCSSGIFLDLALEQGWKETHGVELNKKEAEIARSKHHNVQSCVLSELNFEDKFDAITLWDVFEHIKDGKAYLESFKNYLAPDGVLFLQVPNAGSLAARILHDKCNMFDGLEHVNLYSPKTIKLLVEQAGYNVVAMKSVIPETNVIANYLSFDDPYLGNQPATDGFLEMISNDEILDKLLGYKIQVALKAI